MRTFLSSKTIQIKYLGTIGYGEVGKIIMAGMASHIQNVQAWDLNPQGIAPVTLAP